MLEALFEHCASLDQQGFRCDAFLSHLLIDQFVMQDEVGAPVSVRIDLQFFENRVDQAQADCEDGLGLRRVVYRAVCDSVSGVRKGLQSLLVDRDLLGEELEYPFMSSARPMVFTLVRGAAWEPRPMA
ncbi:hypothetical protein [Streptomyces narbonensis]|uniref:hypothetical protein n=1 Tax=Streptomyces narbonensis TaxID=67333 RepID=UPI0033E0494A